jgi:hypothetical protein
MIFERYFTNVESHKACHFLELLQWKHFNVRTDNINMIKLTEINLVPNNYEPSILYYSGSTLM